MKGIQTLLSKIRKSKKQKRPLPQKVAAQNHQNRKTTKLSISLINSLPHMVRNNVLLLSQQAANAETYTLIDASALRRTCLSAEIRCRGHAAAL